MSPNVIYEANRYTKLGIGIWREMITDLLNSRELIWRLFIRNWAVKYKQSLLGYLWALIFPVITIVTFIFLNRTGILNIEKTDMPYPLYALIGLTIWQLFASGLQAGCQSLTSSGSMISKINFSLEALVFASIGQAVFEFFIKLFLIAGLMTIYKIIPPLTAVFFIFSITPIFLLTLGVSLILALLNGILRDTANALPLLTNLFMFLTPVVYPIPTGKSLLFKLNPLSSLINTPRDLLVTGRINDPISFFVSAIFSILIFLICWRIFYLVKTKIPERV